MSYQINKSDGTIIADVADGQIDNLSTDLTLIGKNYSGFGEFLNENLVKLLENFSNVESPKNPLRGQLWYDVSEGKIKVYNGNQFVPVSSATIATSQPLEIGVGDLWYNSIDRQLYLYNGTQSVLLGPSFSASQGRSGIEVQSILDSQNQTRVITSLYNNGTLIGIFSKDKFIPSRPIQGFSENAEGIPVSKEIQPGFNIGTHKVRVTNPLTGLTEDVPLTFRVTAEDSEKLGGQLASLYVRNDVASNTLLGQLRVRSNLGIDLGEQGLISLSVVNNNLIISNNSNQSEVRIDVRNDQLTETAIHVKPAIRTVEIYEGFTNSQTILGGNLIVGGNLTVQGDTTTISTSELAVEDKSIELARVSNPTETTANLGGIILKGSSDKIMLWAESAGQTYELSDSQSMDLKSYAWNFSEHINLADNKSFYINGTELFRKVSADKYALGIDVIALDGVTIFGKQSQVTVGPGLINDPPILKIENNEISIEGTNEDLVISPNGNIILTDSPRIIGLGIPLDLQDATTKEYVDNKIETRNLVLSADVSDDITPTAYANTILSQIAPVDEYRPGTFARVICTRTVNNPLSLNLNSLITDSTEQFVKSVDPLITGPAVVQVSANTLEVPGQGVTVSRVIWIFRVDVTVAPEKAWVFVEERNV